MFDTVYSWLCANKPSQLYSKTNRDGYRLLPSKMAVCWIMVEIDGEMKAKLFVGSTYDGGSQGGNCGIAHQLFRVAREINQPGGHDAVNAEHGVQIVIEKTSPDGSKYPSYKMTRSHMAAPIGRYLERMQDAELAALCPLHEVLYRVEPEEEWELVAKVIGEELRDEIRDSTAKPQPTPSPESEPVPIVTAEPSTVSDELPTADDESSQTSDDRWIW